MAGRGKRKREKLFRLYAANLSIYCPQYQGIFACPICRTGFHPGALDVKPPALTIAHIIPKAVGRGPETLACDICNSTIGSSYDSHAKKVKDHAEWLSGTRPARAVLSNEAAEVAVDWRYHENLLHLTARPNESPPGALQQFVDRLRNAEDGTFSIKMELYDAIRVRASVFHSAFLAMFFLFGYEYVLSPWVKVARQALCGEPAPGLLSRVVGAASGVPETGFSLGVMTEPLSCRCFILTLPCAGEGSSWRSVLLPGLGQGADDAYRALVSSETPLKRLRARIVWEGLTQPPLDDPVLRFWGCRLWRNSLRSP